MANDLFDQLADKDVPPPPEQFDQQVHWRLNRTLLAMHCFEMCTQCLPWFLKHFIPAVVATVRYSLTGCYETKRKNQH